MADLSRSYEDQRILRNYIFDAHVLIPDLKKYYIRLNQMNTLLHELLKDIKNNELFFDAQDIQLHSDMDPHIVDTLSSIKLLLAAIQKDIDLLYSRSIHVKSLDKGIFGITVPQSHIRLQLLWCVGDKEILYWEDTDDVGVVIKRPIHALASNAEQASEICKVTP